MDIKEIRRRLHEKGLFDREVESQLKWANGPSCSALEHRFQEDIADTLVGQATLDHVIARNKGADLADPWPVA